MKNPFHQSTTLAAACLLLTACSTVPDWSAREVREHRITAVYDGGLDDTVVSLPTSNDSLLILSLSVEPTGARQSFTALERRLHLPPGLRNVRVRCRYRVFRPAGEADGAPWPTPESLFPGATRVERH